MKKEKIIILLVLYAFSYIKASDNYMGDVGVVVVTPDYFPQSLNDSSPQMRVIDSKEIKSKNADTLNDLLKNEAGLFEVSERGTLGSLSSLSMRSGGGAANEALILIDGVPLNSPADGQLDLAEISADYIERIEVLRGGSSYMYGGNSVGGVVNIITKKPVADSLAVKTKLGSFGERNLNLSGSKYFSDKYLYVSLDGKTIEGWRDNTEFQEGGVFIKSGNDNLNATLRYVNNTQGLSGLNYTAIDDWDDDIERVASTPNAEQKKQIFEINMNAKDSSHSIQTSYMKHLLNYDKGEDVWPEHNDTDWQKVFVSVKTKTFIEGLDLGMESAYSIYDKTDHIDRANDVDKELVVLSVLGQQKLTLATLENSLSIRYDNSKWGDVLSPRLSVIKKINDIKFGINLAQSFNPPNFNDLYWKGGYGEGNPDLEPEKSKSADFGVELRKNRFLINLALFYSILEDKISWALNDATSLWEPQNLDKVRNYGLEQELSCFILTNLECNIYYNYITSEVKNDKWDLLRYTAQHKGGIGFTYSPVKSLSVNVNARAQSESYSSDAETGIKIEPYTLLNATIKKRLSDFVVYGKVENVLDEKYITRRGYPLPGMRLELGMNWDVLSF